MIVEGKIIAQEIENELKAKFAAMPEKKVCFIQFGENTASKKFIEMKSKVALRIGVLVDIFEVQKQVNTARAMQIVADAVAGGYDGIVVQLPLPQGIDTQAVLDAVPPEKDIDILSTKGKLGAKYAPVARAVIEILRYHHVELEGKKILIVGNGKLVGQPVADMFSKMHIPCVVVDGTTPAFEKGQQMLLADIIISGAGVPNLIKPEMVKPDVILIDAGTSEDGGRLVGDIDPACSEKASIMTPVPGGVGPITVVSLFANLL
jgi:methylenetetrahydrofolate dehydrogenase (NADP+)/methenyltetrahydrofolate cyclohydrolase